MISDDNWNHRLKRLCCNHCVILLAFCYILISCSAAYLINSLPELIQSLFLTHYEAFCLKSLKSLSSA